MPSFVIETTLVAGTVYSSQQQLNIDLKYLNKDLLNEDFSCGRPTEVLCKLKIIKQFEISSKHCHISLTSEL